VSTHSTPTRTVRAFGDPGLPHRDIRDDVVLQMGASSASLDRSVECVYICGYNMAAMRIGIRELKARAPQVVREVRETGEAVDITYYGEVVARLTPVEAAKEPGTREAAWKEFDAVARAVGKRTGGRARSTPDWRRRL